MAHHGGLANQTSASQSLQQQQQSSIAPPRPPMARTPFRPASEQSEKNLGDRVSEERPLDTPHHHPLHLPVTKQPGVAAAASVKKDAPGSSSSGVSAPADAGTSAGNCFRGSIVCPECERCRCNSCRNPRPLPSRWLCNNACFCSAETSLDYASCLCCVKGFFYHCSKDYELDHDDGSASCADDPCSCGPRRCLARWGCLAAVSLVLPCLWCYWPLKGRITGEFKCGMRAEKWRHCVPPQRLGVCGCQNPKDQDQHLLRHENFKSCSGRFIVKSGDLFTEDFKSEDFWLLPPLFLPRERSGFLWCASDRWFTHLRAELPWVFLVSIHEAKALKCNQADTEQDKLKKATTDRQIVAGIRSRYLSRERVTCTELLTAVRWSPASQRRRPGSIPGQSVKRELESAPSDGDSELVEPITSIFLSPEDQGVGRR
ncbi:Protein sprouty [Zootermopsis nevadensis]|uniref:Protein sprouty n=1 Tax=Zootermopsis nevadensis TaxID=136037 RepID=A0A067R888_ZOONE|nr:Protein sprouty [Zootermopsis nevadensis]